MGSGRSGFRRFGHVVRPELDQARTETHPLTEQTQRLKGGSMFDDLTPRYVPRQLMTLCGMQPVQRIIGYNPGQHPKECPLKPDISVIQCVTPGGSRWFGVKTFKINAELRMVITGTNPRDTVRMRWEACRIP
jgi:hypothetical protein